MKNLLSVLVVCLLSANLVFAQETTVFYQSNSVVANSKDNAKFYVVYKPMDNGLVAYKKFSSTNTLLEKGSLQNMTTMEKEGEIYTYYKNGQVKDMVTYSDGLPNGKKIHYFESGKVNFVIDYKSAGYGLENANISVTKYLFCANPKGEVLLDSGNGTFYEYDAEENVTQEGVVLNSLPDGTWKGYENNRLAFKEVYKNGNMISGERYGADGQVFSYTARNSRPEPKGGMNKFYNFIVSGLQSAVIEEENKVSGKVMLKFVVESNGKLQNIKVVNSSNPKLASLAVNVLNHAPKWNPATQQGLPVEMAFYLPINLR